MSGLCTQYAFALRAVHIQHLMREPLNVEVEHQETIGDKLLVYGEHKYMGLDLLIYREGEKPISINVKHRRV